MDESRQAKLLRKLNDDKQGVSGSTSTTELCDLPDSLLHHILSFLPTKFAFRTSVLSKRWHHLSESMPCLRFSELDFDDGTFCDAVDSALLPRDMSYSIHKFSLKCLLAANGISRINRWITAAVKHNVKVLKLYFPYRNLLYRLPHCIFMSETLVELELDMDAPLIIPTSTGLSNLKILTIRRVAFVDEESTQKLLSCPTLEELTIYECGWNDIKLLKVSAPSLLKLSIMDDQLSDLDERSDFPHTCQVLIHGAQIRSLTCCSAFIKYCITTSPLLLDAKVRLDCPSKTVPLMVQTVAANNASMLLNGLSSVQILTLNSSILEAISSRDELLNALPTFSKLTKLSLTCPYDSVKHPARFPWAMFERFPHLETLEYLAFRFDGPPSNPPDSVPICFRSHLKKIVVDCFDPEEPSISHLVQLLGISMCLEELVVLYGWDNRISTMKPKVLLKRLTRLPKASANCRISVVVTRGKVFSC